MYYLDGRDKPEHHHHHTYTGLAEKFRGLPSTQKRKTYQLEDGSIRVEVGEFWKVVVSSWHLVDSAKKTNSSKLGVITTGSGLAGAIALGMVGIILLVWILFGERPK